MHSIMAPLTKTAAVAIGLLSSVFFPVAHAHPVIGTSSLSLVDREAPTKQLDTRVTGDMKQCQGVPSWFLKGHFAGQAEKSNNFCAAKYKDSIWINGLSCKADNYNVRWLRVEFTDNSNLEMGDGTVDDKGRRDSWQWVPGADKITDMKLWQGPDGHAVIRIKITFSNDKVFDCGANGIKDEDARNIPVGGMLAGLYGFSSGAIDMLEPYFTATKTVSVTVRDIEFSNPTFEDINKFPVDKRGFKPVHSLEYAFTNDRADESTTIRLESYVDVKTSHSWTSSTTAGWLNGGDIGGGLKADIKGPFGDITGVELSLGAVVEGKYRRDDYNSTVKGDQNGVELVTRARFGIAADVAPGKAVKCSAIVIQGSTPPMNYKGKIDLQFEGGGVLTYEAKGTFSQVTASQAFASCQDIKPESTTGNNIVKVTQSGAYDANGKYTGPA